MKRGDCIWWDEINRKIQGIRKFRIQEARTKNIALLSKPNWRIYQEQEAPWAKVILNKCCSSSRVRSRDPEKLPSSPNWKAINLGFPTFKKGIFWGIRNGTGFSVWLDNWINGDSLGAMIKGSLRQEEQIMKVADLRCVHDWNWELISFELPECIKNRIRAVLIRLFGDEKDTIMWKYSKDGEFSTKSAYQLANQGEILDTQFHG